MGCNSSTWEREVVVVDELVKLEITHVPEVVYTSHQGAYVDPESTAADALANGQHVTWLFHLVFRGADEAYHIEQVEMEFLHGRQSQWSEIYPRSYLERLSWIEGAIEYNTKYFLENVEFIDNKMSPMEREASPDIPADRAVTWARIEVGKPHFAQVDEIHFNFQMKSGSGELVTIEHTVPIQEWNQKVELRLPFEGTWIAKSGNELTSGHRRTGLNGLTTYGWDLMKVGENGRIFRTDGSTPQDFYTYNEPVYAPAGGTVVHVRNDIEEYEIGMMPPRGRLEEDGDVFAGNLVVIDHGNGEYTLTSHMLAGTVPVRVGEKIERGHLLGRAGNSGASMVPHIHINLMDRPEWLEARGIPSLYSDFYWVPTGGAAKHIVKGNPLSGWVISPTDQ
jgi:hypothetical protein